MNPGQPAPHRSSPRARACASASETTTTRRSVISGAPSARLRRQALPATVQRRPDPRRLLRL